MKSAGLLGFVSIVLLGAHIGGCVNISTLQTAKALEPGRQQFLVGGGFYASPSLDASADEATEEDTSLALPYLELGYRRGLAEHLELGAKVTVPGTIGLDGKYQLLDAGDFAVAAGLGFGYLSISSGSGEDEVSTQVIDAIVPVYVSYDLASYFAVYASPKLVLRYASSTDDGSMSTSAFESLAGGTAGFRLGNRRGVYLEASYLKDISSTFDSFQVNGSIFF